MSVAEGYSISVQCDGAHPPGLEVRREVYGYTKQLAHKELRRLGWRLGANFTAYCPACSHLPPRTRGVVACDDPNCTPHNRCANCLRRWTTETEAERAAGVPELLKGAE